MIRRWCILVLVACGPSLSGHPSPVTSDPSWQTEARNEELRSQAQRVQRSCERDLLDEELTPIAEKLPLNLNVAEVAFDMLALDESPTEDEQEAIVELVSRRADCHVALSKVLGPPPLWIIHQRQRNTAALASLYAGDMSYGEFNRRLQEINATADKERADEEFRAQMLAQAQMQTNAAQAQAYQAQLAAQAQERARLDAQYQNALQNFAKAFAPKPTVNCTSRAYGNSVDTTCQ